MTNTWDSASQQITSQDVTGITSYVWDLDSRKIATQNPTGINLTSTLDPVGNRLLLADLFGVTTYTWDIQSRLTGFVNPITQFAPSFESVSITRDPLDRELIRNFNFPSFAVSHVYDAAGRETALNTNAFLAPNFTNYYDSVNNRIGVVESSGSAVSFLFDSAYQLINETRSGTNPYNITYGYDPLGNRLTQNAGGQITTRTFNSANAQLTSTPPSGPITSSSYDPNGNLILQNTGGALTTNTWSPENRLLSNVSAAGSEIYQYSQDGLRKQKTNSSGTSLFCWDEQNMLLSTDTSLNLQTRQTDYPGYWGGLAFQEVGGYTNIPLFDSQGNTRFAYWIINNSFFWADYIYDSFGNLLSTPPSEPNSLEFGGQYGYNTDATGLIYVRARYYDPKNGRWISRDPIGFDGGDVNLYPYVGNNPVNKIDPSGAITITPYSDAKSKWKIGDVSPDVTCCGAYQTYWLFKLSKSFTEDGWIVQHISFTADGTQCPPGSGGLGGPPRTDYYEAWHVKANSQLPDSSTAWTDQLANGGFKNTKGMTNKTGAVRFYLRSKLKVTGDVPPGMYAPPDKGGKNNPFQNCWNYSGGLICSDQRPSFWDPMADNGNDTQSAHNVNADWNCCPVCGDNSPTNSHTKAYINGIEVEDPRQTKPVC